MEIILILCVPLMIGGMWGFWQARSQRFSWVALVTAPVVSAVLIGVVIAMMNMIDPPDSVLAKSWGERIVIYLATGCLYGAGFGLFGALPALVGSAGTQLFVLWAVNLLASNRRRGSRDIPAIPAEGGRGPGSS